MAAVWNILLISFAVFAKKSQGIDDKLLRLFVDQGNEENPSYNENQNEIADLLKTGTTNALCAAGKISSVWCQYKELMDPKNIEQQARLLKRESAGLSRSSKGLIPGRSVRATEQGRKLSRRTSCYPGLPWTCKGLVAARSARALLEDNEDKDENDEKRAMKCRPGMVNCRRKNGKRVLEQVKPKHCPQGWPYCI